MSKDLVIQDVCDVVITDMKGNVVANTKLQMSALEGTISEEDLRAGIGNGKIFKIRSEKDLNLNFRSAVFNAEWLAMTQGVEVKQDTIEVTRAETICIDGGEFTTEGTPVATSLYVKNEEGKFVKTEFTGKIIDKSAVDLLFPIAAATDEGVQEVTVHYKEEVTGESIAFDAKAFSAKYRVELHTIAYDLETATIASDIFFVFYEAMPGGDFSLSFEAGSVITPEISFSVLQPKCGTVMGKMIDVPRVDTP